MGRAAAPRPGAQFVGSRSVAPAFADACAAARAPPGVEESPHQEIVSIRVRGRIVATAPDVTHQRVVIDEGRVLDLVARAPDVYHPVCRGRRVAAVAVELTRAEVGDEDGPREEARRRRAPASWTAPDRAVEPRTPRAAREGDLRH